jgi:hypothetical protein
MMGTAHGNSHMMLTGFKQMQKSLVTTARSTRRLGWREVGATGLECHRAKVGCHGTLLCQRVLGTGSTASSTLAPLVRWESAVESAESPE